MSRHITLKKSLQSFGTPLLLLLFLYACASLSVSLGGDFAVVTTEHGYVVDEDDLIIETLPPLSIVDISEPGSPWLVVKTTSGQKGWIRSEQVHQSSRFSYINDENSNDIREILSSASSALKLESDGDQDDAIAAMSSALKSMEEKFGKDNTGYAWLLAYKAFMQINAGDLAAAESLLNEAERVLRDLGELKSLHAADWLNTKASLASDKGDLETAIALYQESLLLSSAVLGVNHADIRTITSNLADTYAQKGDLDVAIRTRQRAKEIGTTIFPPDVAERINDCLVLANYFSDAERHEEAFVERLEAFQMIAARDYNPFPLAVTTQIDLATSHYTLGQSAVARYRLKKVKAALDEYDPSTARLDDDYSQSIDVNLAYGNTFYMLGLVEQTVERNELALDYFRQSIAKFESAGSPYNIALSATEAGHIAAKLENVIEATRFYQTAIDIYKEQEGDDSESASELVSIMENLSTAKVGSEPGMKTEQIGSTKTEFVMVSSPEAYLLDETGNPVSLVTACTLLEVVSQSEKSFNVKHDSRVLEISKGVVRSNSTIPANRLSDPDIQAIFSQIAEGRKQTHKNQYEAAIPIFEKAYQDAVELLGDTAPLSIFSKCQLASTYGSLGQVSKAQEVMSSMDAAIENFTADDIAVMFDVWFTKANLAFLVQDSELTERYAVMTLEVLDATDRLQSVDAVAPETALAILEVSSGQVDAAITRMERIMLLVEQILSPDSSVAMETRALFGLILTFSDATTEGDALITNAVEAARLRKDDRGRLTTLLGLQGVQLNALGKTEDAKRAFEEVILIYRDDQSFHGRKTLLNAFTELASSYASEQNLKVAGEQALKGLAVADRILSNPLVSKAVIRDPLARLHGIAAAALEEEGDLEGAKDHKRAMESLAPERNDSERPKADRIKGEDIDF